jgi:cytochrome c nitrite reductase small subunit
MKKILIWLAALGILGFGMMLMTKIPALGLSEASFCGKCHAMDYQVSTYLHSPHANQANCGECHDPHGLVTGSMYAAYTGSRDVYRVVTNTTPTEIRATDMSKKVLQSNCLRCHGDVMGEVGDTSKNGGVYCFQCHRNIVHPKS